MKLRQLSLFLENRPGQLRAPCEALGQAGVDILTMSLADTAQFGILRLIVKDHEQARKALEAAGCVVNLTEVMAAEVPDRPGGLAEVLGAFEAAGLSIEYMYPFLAGRRERNAVLVFRLEDPDKATALLEGRGVRLLSREEVLSRVGA